MDLVTRTCPDCNSDIPLANYQVHEIQCAKYRMHCEKCGDVILKDCYEEHMEEAHKKVPCQLCNEIVEHHLLLTHQNRVCPKKLERCQYCDLDYPRDQLGHHASTCGSRTDKCPICRQFVMLKDMKQHELTTCHSDKASASARQQINPTAVDHFYRPDTKDRLMNQPLSQNRPRHAGKQPRVTDKVTPELLANSKQASLVSYTEGIANSKGHSTSQTDPRNDYDILEHDDANGEGDDNDKIPCEFCDELIYFDQLVEHQMMCQKNEFVNQPVTTYIQIYRPLKQKDDKPCECEACKKFYEDDEKEESLLPCQFCDFPCPPSQLRWHELRCPKQPALDDFDPMTDPLPVQNQPVRPRGNPSLNSVQSTRDTSNWGYPETQLPLNPYSYGEDGDYYFYDSKLNSKSTNERREELEPFSSSRRSRSSHTNSRHSNLPMTQCIFCRKAFPDRSIAQHEVICEQKFLPATVSLTNDIQNNQWLVDDNGGRTQKPPSIERNLSNDEVTSEFGLKNGTEDNRIQTITVRRDRDASADQNHRQRNTKSSDGAEKQDGNRILKDRYQ